MNFLAHIFLSGPNEEVLIGNFMADFINGNKFENYPKDIIKGIKLHRAIDQYTDKHPMVRKGVKRFQKIHSKYAPVVIDIVYDHLLANAWDNYSSTNLRTKADSTYTSFSKYSTQMPGRLEQRIFKMIDDDFLYAYKSLKGLNRSLGFMDRRTKFPSNFISASIQLYEEWDQFNTEFDTFMPDIIKFSEDFIQNYPSK